MPSENEGSHELPTGEWLVAGIGTQPFTMPALGAFGTIQTTVLFLPRGDHIDAVLEVNANSIPVNDGWGRTKACADGDQFLVVDAVQDRLGDVLRLRRADAVRRRLCRAAGLGAGARFCPQSKARDAATCGSPRVFVSAIARTLSMPDFTSIRR